jgi:hypothetical protein
LNTHRIGARERRSFACAAIALALALAWQFFDVRYNYGGNWTGLFCIGDKLALPPSLADRDLYRVPQSQGYDGQFYYYVSHDPFLQSEFLQYVDNSPLRWRRILLPALAHVMAFGRADFIAPAYIGIVLASVFAGSWWLSRLCQSASYNPFWGLSFLTVPAVATSLDRMTVDSLLAALSVAFGYYGVHQPSWRIYPVLLLAPLVRETGLVLPAAFGLFCIFHRRFREAALGMVMAIPWLGWTLFIHARLWSDGTPWLSAIPFSGLVVRTFEPVQFEITGQWLAMAAFLDYLALLGLWFGVWLAAGFIWKKKFGLLELATAIFAGSAMFVAKPDVWADAYAFARTMSPMLIWLALIGIAAHSLKLLIPLALSIPRIAQQIGTMSISFPRGMLHDATVLVSLCVLASSWLIWFAPSPESREDARLDKIGPGGEERENKSE